MLHVTSNSGVVTCNVRENNYGARLGVAQRVQKHRLALRAAGLRPVQIWVPGTRRARFAAEYRRQCLALRNGPSEADGLAISGTSLYVTMFNSVAAVHDVL
jgi:hypothetical protein